MATADGEQKPVKKPGFADIKKEYVRAAYASELALEYVSEAVKAEVEGAASRQAEGAASLPADPQGPPKKKQKLKGQNKQRKHHHTTITSMDKLCNSVFSGKPCNWGDRCKYTHDVKAFLKAKAPDIGERCEVFEKYGVCSYGVTCRFGSAHTSPEGHTVENEAKKASVAPLSGTFRNYMGSELRVRLRKKQYDFQRADAASDASVKLVAAHHQSAGEPGAKSEGVAEPVSSAETPSDHTAQPPTSHTAGAVTDEGLIRLRPGEKKTLDFRDKLYLAPLTTVGNLPFRRTCVSLGADVTCGEMALATNLLQGSMAEWALVRRHETEKCFGVQLCGGYPDTMTRCAQLMCETVELDFIDINVGCPIDLIYQKGAGSGLMNKVSRFESLCRGMSSVMDIPLTCKLRTGVREGKNTAHNVLPGLSDWGISLATLHGRTREQRYTRSADWLYIAKCREALPDFTFFGNGDVLSYEDYCTQREASGVDGIMVARGALIKPWIFTEIKERRHWDISSTERLDILKEFTSAGLEHWGSDTQGVETSRRFMLEWLSFLYRYIPVGLLERVPQAINERPPPYVGRDDLETLMGSPFCGDWVKISEMLLGPVPKDFSFIPKHKANAYKS